MATFTRGFTRPSNAEAERVPPGQHLTAGFPVLSAGATPKIDPETWTLSLITENGVTKAWSLEDLRQMAVSITADIHCVTSWTKLDTRWRGVPLDALFEGVNTDMPFLMAHSHGGYTTNLSRAETRGDQAWVVFEYDDAPLTPEHGGPVRLLVPGRYFWKSAKWLRAIVMQPENKPGFWEQYGYHLHGDPWREERYS
jgi:DMSO/TMAO reductase YedYZ molybdopterin-dependent catalytic subunit